MKRLLCALVVAVTVASVAGIMAQTPDPGRGGVWVTGTSGGSGDITSVVAGAGMTGGGTTGDVTLNVIGTADAITVSADAVTIASTYVGQTSITTLGTVATGTWQATDVGVAYGGTGASTLTANSLLLGAGTSAVTFAAPGTSGNVLTSNGTVWASATPAAITSLDTGTVAYAGRTITVDTGGVLNVVLAAAAGDDFTVDTDKLVVSGDSGDVGIGTASPKGLLNLVEGNVLGMFSIKESSNAYGFDLGLDSNGDGVWRRIVNNVATEAFRVQRDTGEVGINTAAPVSLLDVRGPTGTGTAPAGVLTLATNELTIVDNDQLGRIEFRSPIATAGTDAIVTAASIWAEANATFSASVNSADIVFATAASGAATEKMRILSSGNVGIGIAAPTRILHVVGDITLQSSQAHMSDGYGLLWGDNGFNGNAATDSLRFDTAGGARLTINSAGLVTVGNNLTVTEDIVVTGAGPHAIGGPTIGYVGTIFGGAFTSSGASTTASGILTNQLVVGAGGDTGSIVGSRFASALRTQTATESIAHIAQVHIEDPQIDDNLTGDITIAASLYIKNAPTEGETNAALYVASGESYFDDNVGFGTTPIANDSGYFQTFFPLTSVLNGVGGVDGNFNIQQNAYNHTGNNSFYAATDQASQYLMTAGVHYFRVAASGDADTQITWTDALVVNNSGNVAISGALSKGSGSFRITHPLPALAETHELVHSFIEGPRADLIYRGIVTMVDGAATVDLDDAAGMTAGTWVLLCRDPQVFTSNATGWSPVRGTVSGSTLTIECEEGTCTDTISWMVVAERQDQHIIDTDWTDEDGRPIIEPLKPPAAAPAPTAPTGITPDPA